MQKLEFVARPADLSDCHHLLAIAPGDARAALPGLIVDALGGGRGSAGRSGARGAAGARAAGGGRRDAEAVVHSMLRDLQPGLLAGLATTLLAGGDRRVTVAVLPNRASRHNSPARAESIRKAVEGARLEAKACGVLIVLDTEGHALAAANAVARALPLFSRKSAPWPARSSVSVALVDRHGVPVALDAQARAIVESSRAVAQLVDAPPTEMNPAALAAAARGLLRGTGAKVQEIVGPQLLKHGLGGIHAVGRCALVPPRMLVATVGPRRASAPHIALVGKGITYDTGGLHLKARGMMETMKADMGGAAAVLGAFRVLARRKLPVRLSLVLCLAENAIGPAAYKPDDILTMHSGKTVEINNTDAEGRLLLADGVSYACRRLGAQVVFDAATLTGAQLIATGDLHAAVVSNDQGLEDLLLTAGRVTGDLTWALPFVPEFYKSEFQSPIADMRNSVKNRNNAQSSCAATFVHWHIDDLDVRWAHVDLAGPAFVRDRATGYGVALLAQAVGDLATA